MASALAYVQREYLDVLFSYDSDFLALDGALTNRFHVKEPHIDQLPLFPSETKSLTKAVKAQPQNLL